VILELALAGAAVLGLLFGLRCYLELRRWARICQRVRIAIAHKQRVQLDAPLTEWIAWANGLGRDEASRGRVLYRNGHVSVAILKPSRPVATLERRRRPRLSLRRRRSSSAEAAA
jgi:hypothetical protein